MVELLSYREECKWGGGECGVKSDPAADTAENSVRRFVWNNNFQIITVFVFVFAFRLSRFNIF